MPNAERYARDKDRAAAKGTTPHRQRVARAQRHSPGISRRQAAGHPGRGEVRVSRIERQWTELQGQPTTKGSRESGRMGQLAGDVGKLSAGSLSPEAFDFRWSGKRIGDYTAPSAAEALAHARAHGPSPDRPYRRIPTGPAR
jgi:hypothetical protein